eukprot:SAG31_NODE_13685_length_853_cov_1.372679_1_plen_79_part_00
MRRGAAMEDAKLEAYYNELKAAAPKGGRGGLGTTKGPKSKKGGGFETSRAGTDGLSVCLRQMLASLLPAPASVQISQI